MPFIQGSYYNSRYSLLCSCPFSPTADTLYVSEHETTSKSLSTFLSLEYATKKKGKRKTVYTHTPSYITHVVCILFYFNSLAPPFFDVIQKYCNLKHENRFSLFIKGNNVCSCVCVLKYIS